MNLLLLAPAVVVLAGVALGVARLLERIGPRPATWLATVATAMAAVGVIAATVQVAVGGLADGPGATILRWCRALYALDHGVAPWIGLVAAGGLAAMGVNVVQYLRRVRREMAPFRRIDGVHVVQVDGPVAFAVPGRRGGVIVGSDLLSALQDDERAAVLAHEHAHLRHHHHRFVRTADVCAAAVPVLRPLARMVRQFTERWADETAAAVIGSRQTLASAIARAALMSPDAGVAPSMAHRIDGAITLLRVEALMGASPESSLRATVPGLAAVALVAGGSALQVHHLAAFLVHLCPT